MSNGSKALRCAPFSVMQRRHMSSHEGLDRFFFFSFLPDFLPLPSAPAPPTSPCASNEPEPPPTPPFDDPLLQEVDPLPNAFAPGIAVLTRRVYRSPSLIRSPAWSRFPADWAVSRWKVIYGIDTPHLHIWRRCANYSFDRHISFGSTNNSLLTHRNGPRSGRFYSDPPGCHSKAVSKQQTKMVSLTRNTGRLPPDLSTDGTWFDDTLQTPFGSQDINAGTIEVNGVVKTPPE